MVQRCQLLERVVAEAKTACGAQSASDSGKRGAASLFDNVAACSHELIAVEVEMRRAKVQAARVLALLTTTGEREQKAAHAHLDQSSERTDAAVIGLWFRHNEGPTRRSLLATTSTATKKARPSKHRCRSLDVCAMPARGVQPPGATATAHGANAAQKPQLPRLRPHLGAQQCQQVLVCHAAQHIAGFKVRQAAR